MPVMMRIIQQFDAVHQKEFLELEAKFAQLEARRADYPKGRRLRPIAAAHPCNTLIWECQFPDIQTARKTLDFFCGDHEHEALLEQQLPYFRQVHVEFYDVLDF